MSVVAGRARLRGTILNGEPTIAKTKRRGGDGQSVAAGVNLNLGADRFFGITRTLRRQLVYTQAVGQQTTAAGDWAEGTFVLNNAYNLGAGAATGFTKYMGFYSKCFVLSSRWVVRGIFTGGVTNAATLVATVSTNATAFTDAQAAIKAGLSQWRVVGGSPDAVMMQGRVNHSKFLTKPNYLDDPQLFCTSAAGPSQVIVLHVGIDNFVNSTQVQFTYIVEIVMDCIFTDPIPFT